MDGIKKKRNDKETELRTREVILKERETRQAIKIGISIRMNYVLIYLLIRIGFIFDSYLYIEARNEKLNDRIIITDAQMIYLTQDIDFQQPEVKQENAEHSIGKFFKKNSLNSILIFFFNLFNYSYDLFFLSFTFR